MGKKALRNKDAYADREAKKYENPIPSREFILTHLADRESPATYRQLLDELELSTPEDQEALRRRLIAMVRDGQLHQNRKGAYGPLSKMELIKGRIISHKDGFGFVEPDEGGNDLYLSPKQMRAVFPGDRVLARVIGVDHRGRREAMIVEVTERNTHTLVGRFLTESGISLVQPSNQKIPHDILIPPEGKGNAQSGQVVIVEITEQPTATNRPLGTIISILGDHMAPGMEIEVAIHNHDIPHEWPADVEKEAAHFTSEVDERAKASRKDFRDLPFVTIDGEDAKDFDDAVYCMPLPHHQGWKLYVAIADVSHYVKPNSALDREALNRGNSVYFPGQVVPMLPEILSNELCSLKPLVDRLSLVCEMTLSPQGNISHYEFHEAVIRSHARLTYTLVHALLTENDPALSAPYETLMPHLRALSTVYHTLHQTRQARGAIDFDLPETKIIFGKGRKIEKIIQQERNDAHRLIEECMLCANICAARLIEQYDLPALYRIHEGPSPEKLMDLRKFLQEMGLKLPGNEEPTPKDYADLLSAVVDRPDAHMIQTALLRSLSQAIYSPENKGHFGLAFDSYAHFTSPIRRYPDLLVHRSIRHHLQHPKASYPLETPMEHYGEHCSMTERRADEATREAIEWLKCEFMLDKVGADFSGVISGVTSFGLFVELSDIYIEGLIHVTALENDYYHFDAIKHCLIGERTGKRFRLGDVVNVTVARVDLDDRKIDLVLIDNDPAPKKKSKKNKKKL